MESGEKNEHRSSELSGSRCGPRSLKTENLLPGGKQVVKTDAAMLRDSTPLGVSGYTPAAVQIGLRVFPPPVALRPYRPHTTTGYPL